MRSLALFVAFFGFAASLPAEKCNAEMIDQLAELKSLMLEKNKDMYNGCLKNVKSQKQDEVFMKCMPQIITELKTKMLKEPPTSVEIKAALFSAMDCAIKVMDLAPNGTLIVEPMVEDYKVSDGDNLALMFIKESTRSCADKTSGNDPAEHLFRMSICVLEETIDFCDETDRDAGKLKFIVPMLSIFENSTCATVQPHEELETIFKECMESTKTATEKKSRRRRHAHHSHHHSHKGMDRKNSYKNRMFDIFKCVGNKIGTLDKETGWNITAYKSYVSSFAGWENIPEEKEDVLEAMDECSDDYTGGIVDQAMKFSKCLFPKYSEICGLRNRLALFLFPLLNHVFPRDLLATITKKEIPDAHHTGNILTSLITGELDMKHFHLQSFMEGSRESTDSNESDESAESEPMI